MLLNHVDLNSFYVIKIDLRVFLLKTIYANATSLDQEVKQ